MPKPLTISIVTYNSADYIISCLQALNKQTFQEFDLIVVDNASEDSTLAEVNRICPNARIIHLQTNIGFGAAHNVAFHSSDTEYNLILNPDCVLKENALRRLLNAAELHEDAGVIGPCILRPGDESIVDSTGLVKSIFGSVKDRGTGRKVTGHQQQSEEVWGISGACAMYRKEALESIRYEADGRPEYFDELFFMYKEDVDLAARLQKAGWKAWYQHDAIAYHDRTGNSEQKRSERKQYINQNSYKNHLLFLVKNIRGLNIIPAAIYESAKLMYLLLFERSTLKVMPEVISALPIAWNRRYE